MALDRTAVAGPARRALALDAAWSVAWRDAARAFVVSRVIVLLSGAFATLVWGRIGRVSDFDPGRVTYGFGSWGDPLTATFARWDSTWFLAIAHDGYGPDQARAAFFPLYPIAMRVLGVLTGSDLAAGVVISAACTVGALVVVRRLVALELGDDAARATVQLIALFPMSFFLTAVYSESLFLLLSVGALLAARQRVWALAGLLAMLAALTRSAGLVLLAPLLIVWWRESRRALDVSWLAFVPAGVLLYCLSLRNAGLPFGAAFDAQQTWFRSFAGPFAGTWDGAVAAWDGARQLLSGSRTPVYFGRAGGDPFSVARMNLMLFAFLLLAVPALIGMVRRLPLAWSVYVVCALALPLSYPVGPQPLMSLPRFELVLFPLFAWGGLRLAATGPRVRAGVYLASAAGLAAFTAQFATWHLVA